MIKLLLTALYEPCNNVNDTGNVAGNLPGPLGGEQLKEIRNDR